MKHLILLLSLLCVVSQGIAQPLKWVFRVGGAAGNPSKPEEEDRITCVRADSIGNIYVCGNVYKLGTNVNSDSITQSKGYSDIFLAKFDCNANMLWYRIAGGIWDDRANGLELDNHGHVYIAGRLEAGVNNKWMFFDTLIGDSNIHSWYVAKFDTSGNYLWGKMASNNNHIQSEVYKFRLSKEGRPLAYIICNPEELLPGLNVNEGTYFMELDTAGNFYTIMRPNAGYDWIFSYDFVQTSSGDFFMTGRLNSVQDFINIGGTMYYSAYPVNAYHERYFTYSCDSVGNTRFVKFFTDTLSVPNTASGRAIMSDGHNIYVQGKAERNLVSVGYLFNIPQSLGKVAQFLLKYDMNGNQIWAKHFQIKGTHKLESAMTMSPTGLMSSGYCFGGD